MRYCIFLIFLVLVSSPREASGDLLTMQTAPILTSDRASYASTDMMTLTASKVTGIDALFCLVDSSDGGADNYKCFADARPDAQGTASVIVPAAVATGYSELVSISEYDDGPVVLQGPPSNSIFVTVSSPVPSFVDAGLMMLVGMIGAVLAQDGATNDAGDDAEEITEDVTTPAPLPTPVASVPVDAGVTDSNSSSCSATPAPRASGLRGFLTALGLAVTRWRRKRK